jgi:hypothetical protein
MRKTVSLSASERSLYEHLLRESPREVDVEELAHVLYGKKGIVRPKNWRASTMQIARTLALKSSFMPISIHRTSGLGRGSIAKYQAIKNGEPYK